MARATPPSSILCCNSGPITRQLSGTRWPSPDEVAQGVRRALARLPQPPVWIALSGEAEPTLHPRFGVVVDRVLAARDALAPSASVAVLSNSVSVGVPSILEALERVNARTWDAWRQLVVLTAPELVQIHSVGAVPRERLEEMARTLRDALSGVIVEVF